MYLNERLRGPKARQVDSAKLRSLFHILIESCNTRDYLQQAFGYHCVDRGRIPGIHGTSFSEYVLLHTGIEIPDPIEDNLDSIDDIEVLTLHEVLYDLVAEGTHGDYHSWSNCGWHYNRFARVKAPAYVLEYANKYLPYFETGYLLKDDGEIELILDERTAPLLAERLPSSAGDAAQDQVDHAVQVFRRGTSSWRERRSAVKELADVLEPLRGEIGQLLTSQDESDMFNLLNNFSIRHQKDGQKNEYDRPIFLTWLFYIQLSTIHAMYQLKAARDSD